MELVVTPPTVSWLLDHGRYHWLQLNQHPCKLKIVGALAFVLDINADFLVVELCVQHIGKNPDEDQNTMYFPYLHGTSDARLQTSRLRDPHCCLPIYSQIDKLHGVGFSGWKPAFPPISEKEHLRLSISYSFWQVSWNEQSEADLLFSKIKSRLAGILLVTRTRPTSTRKA